MGTTQPNVAPAIPPHADKVASHSEMLIRSSQRWWDVISLKELWQYRELLGFLVWREVIVKYKQAVLGVVWVVAQPLFNALVFSVVFGRLAKIDSGALPYPVFALAALVPWNFFAGAFGRGSASLVANANLLSKVYFPRIIIPSASIVAGLVDYALSIVLLFCFAIYYGCTMRLEALPVIFLLTSMMVALTIGLSCFLSALSVKYRDVSHLMPYLVQVAFFATPIVYPTTLVPEQYRFWLLLNPMSGIISMFRAMFTTNPLPWGELSYSFIGIFVVGFVGLYTFCKTEKFFADIV